MRERLAARAAAELAGVALDTWRAYVTRGQAPQPDGIDEVFGRRYWHRSTVENWLGNRPRKGSK